MCFSTQTNHFRSDHGCLASFVQVETLRQIHKEHSEGDALVTQSFRGSHWEMWFFRCGDPENLVRAY